MPKPKIAVINTKMPNAFATGKGQKSLVVAVTTGLLDLLDTEELEGVLAHELTHIKNRDVLVLTIASIFSTIAAYLMQFVSMADYMEEVWEAVMVVVVEQIQQCPLPLPRTPPWPCSCLPLGNVYMYLTEVPALRRGRLPCEQSDLDDEHARPGIAR